jgi:rubrerythrin
MPTTKENLAAAFAGESQANRKYLAFAVRAEQECLPQIAKLFRAAAEAEAIHALGHLDNMGGIGTTLQNLETAIAGETYEANDMYPAMVEKAKEEGHKARKMLEYANEAERVHARLFQQALDAMKTGKDLSKMEIYVCPFSGDIEFGVKPDKCPICGEPGDYFKEVS